MSGIEMNCPFCRTVADMDMYSAAGSNDFNCPACLTKFKFIAKNKADDNGNVIFYKEVIKCLD